MAVLLDVVEDKPMEAKMVTVDATKMAKDIATTGRVALYGLYFDTDKADLKPKSAPSLAEIGKLLKADPNLKVYIVGHTDNVGVFDYNVSLSQRRAKSVVDQLVQSYGISPDRLRPAGAGMIAPSRRTTTRRDAPRTGGSRSSSSRRRYAASARILSLSLSTTTAVSK